MINNYPKVEEIKQISEDEFVVNLLITPECDFFKGHFENQPVLPGVGQIDFAIKMASECFKISKLEFRNMPQAKFKKVIAANDDLELHLKKKAGTMSFEYRSNDMSMSSGKVKYA